MLVFVFTLMLFLVCSHYLVYPYVRLVSCVTSVNCYVKVVSCMLGPVYTEKDSPTARASHTSRVPLVYCVLPFRLHAR